MSTQCASSDHLFLVSTPLNLLVSLAIISKEKLKNCHLWFIDQNAESSGLVREQLLQWPGHPFKTVEVFFGAKKNLSKLKHRKAMFLQIDALLKNLSPGDVYVGNDRRIEFQYVMHKVSQRGAVTGHYMDEGMFTYVGRVGSRNLSDKFIDNMLKKLVYGFWWKQPGTVGASGWVNHIYASLPKLVHPLLKQKLVTCLDNDYWQSDLLQAFCRQLVSAVVDGEQLANIDMLLTLADETVLLGENFQKDEVMLAVDHSLAKGWVVAAKYHPRDRQKDALALAPKGVVILPNGVPFEAMLPLLKNDVQIVGDFSTTLITSKLLKPQSRVFALKPRDNMTEHMEFYRALGIEYLSLEPA